MRRRLIFYFLIFSITGFVFGQRAPDVLVDRYGRTITSSVQSQRRTIIANIFLENEININFEYYNGRVIVAIIFLGDHFTNIDSFNMRITADRTFRSYSESYNSIVIEAEGGAFIDMASVPSRPPFGVSKEFRDGRYISKFEVVLPNYKFDVIKYAQEFVISAIIDGNQRVFTAGNEEIRLTQDTGLIMSMAGLM